MLIQLISDRRPFFFEKTSTGGLYFQPGDHASSKGAGTTSASNINSYALSSGIRRTRGDTERYGGKGDMVSSIQRSDGGTKRASFDSDVILVRRSVEIERESTEAASEPYSSH